MNLARCCKRLLEGQAQMASLKELSRRVAAACQAHTCLSLDNEEKVWNMSYIN